MEAQTNEVIAIASVPDFDLNQALSATENSRKNRSIVDPFEPGSTLKPFIVAGALRDGKLKPNSKYYCEKGAFRVADRIIKESDSRHKYEWLTVSEILAKSSNIGMVKIGFQLGAQKTHEILQDFGFGAKTGIPLGGDSRGIIPQTPWRDVKLANISFGHGIAVTALQLANAYTAIANGGVLKEPLLVKSVIDTQTGEKEEFEAKIIRRVLSEDQSKTMLLMLSGVTGFEGTGQNARVAGFPVAGKTGTAQKVDPSGRGYLKGAYISSFAGILPAHQPKYVIYVAIDNPKNKKYYGSEIAAPIFAKVGAYAIRKSGMTPVLLTQENLIEKNKFKQKKSIQKIASQITDSDMPVQNQLLNLSVREVLQKSRQLNVPIRIYGSGKSYSVETESDGEKLKELRVYFQ
jgi:cell division protein FtsI (penicillin-binding protein 3)